MKVYYASDTITWKYLPTLKEAHEFAKQLGRFNAQIELVEVGTDQANMLRLLNEVGGTQKVLRTWELNPRGGLKEVFP